MRIQSISVHKSTENSVDFVELFNLGNVSPYAHDLHSGLIVDMSAWKLTEQARHDTGQQDPMIYIAAPPCTVSSVMQNIKHKSTPEWERNVMKQRLCCNFRWTSVGIRCPGEISSYMSSRQASSWKILPFGSWLNARDQVG